MNADLHELRRRMATRSDSELAEIVANRDGVYTAAAIDVAGVELTSRPPSADHARKTPEQAPTSVPRYELPIGLRLSLWLAVVVGCGSIVMLIIGVVLTLSGVAQTRNMLAFVKYGGYAVISWWIVVAIKRRHAYGQMLLTAVVGVWILYCLTLGIVERDWEQKILGSPDRYAI